LVILSGNAGDGKTAFIQRVEAYAQANGAQGFNRTDNGCTFTLNDIPYETLYDGSQDFEGATNDAVLATFFKAFEGHNPPTDQFTKIIAINEGKLRDFLLGKSQYKWLGEQVRRYLASEDSNAQDSLIFVNLNSRSVVEAEDNGDSILDKLLDRFLDTENKSGFWEHCKAENCTFADRCYITLHF
jgi:hypothetical protein